MISIEKVPPIDGCLQNVLVIKNNRQFARLGGYFFWSFLISIPSLIHAMHSVNKAIQSVINAITSSISISNTSFLIADFHKVNFLEAEGQPPTVMEAPYKYFSM